MACSDLPKLSLKTHLPFLGWAATQLAAKHTLGTAIADPHKGSHSLSILCRQAWLQPVLEPLLPHMLSRLATKWAAILSTGRHLGEGQAQSEDGGPAATDEIVEERLVRELTREHLALLCNAADKLLPGSGIATGAGVAQSQDTGLPSASPLLCSHQPGCIVKPATFAQVGL